MTDIHGHCDERFTSVRELFSSNFDKGFEVGASVAVTIDGESVVDLWAGDADADGTPWDTDTIVNVFSTTKTMAATCILMLLDTGDLDLHAPVARYWPEFGQNGKEAVTVAHVMSHSAGLAGFEPPIEPADLYRWDFVTARLAEQKPWWQPGTASGYHLISQGYLQGELVRRVTGRTIGAFFREEVAVPLDADFHIGLPATEDHRVGHLIVPESPTGQTLLEMVLEGAPPGSISDRAVRSCVIDGSEPRTRAWRGAEIPAGGGTGNARSVARVHSALACGGTVDGVRLMSPAGVARALEEQVTGTDLVLGMPARFGVGFGLGSPTMPIGETAFFWGGMGGSLSVIDLASRMSFAYVMNRMELQRGKDFRAAFLATTALAAARSGAAP